MIKLKQFLAMLLVLFSTFSIAQFSSTPTQMGSTYYGVSPLQYVGVSVDLSADGFTMAVGQRNSQTTNTNQFVKIFKWNSATSLWDLKGSPIPAPNQSTVFGCTVTLTDDGNTVAIGDFSLNQTKGAVYIYDWNGTAWVQRSGTIYGNTINEAVGIEGGVDISGDGKFLAVGSFTNVDFGGYTNPGTVKIYSWDNATSTWQQKGNTLNKSTATADDHFGKVSISNDGNIVAVGYPKPGTKGGVELYSYNAATNTWSQKGSTISYSSGTTQVGYSVELTPDGNTVAISAETIGNAAFIYTWNGSDWQLKGSPIAAISNTQLGDQIDISSNGNSFIIGGKKSYIPGTAGDNNGAALVYDWNGTAWSLRGSAFSGTKGDLLGASVAISDDGGIVAMGAPQYSVAASPNNFQGYAKAYRYLKSCSAGTTAPPIQSISYSCPATSVDLNTAHTGTTPAGSSLVWFTNNTHTGTALSGIQITQATAGTYYAFYYDSVASCYSPASSAVAVGNLTTVDSDGDGIADFCDLDDDNDGILDTAENSCNLTTSTTWSGTASPVTGTNGSGVTANNITMTSVATTGANTSFTASPNGAFNTTNFWSNSAVAGANSLQFVHTWDTTPENTQQANVDGGTRTYTITFAKPVNKAIIHLDRLGGNYQIPPANYFSNSAEFTLTSSGISMKKLAGNNQLIVTGNKFYRSVGDDLGSVNPGTEANNTYGTAAGSIEFSSATGQLFNSLTFTVIGQGIEGSGNDGMEFIIESCIGTDTDGDGIPNHLDLDSDGDGCSDAIEGGAAFTTSDLQNSSMAGGNSGASYIGTPISVTQNLGNTVGNTPSTMGVPTIAGTGQTVNNATNSFVNDCISFVCPPDPYAAQQTWWLADGFNTPIHPVIIDFSTGSPIVSTPSTGYGNGFSGYTVSNGLGYEGNTTVTHPVTKQFLFATDGNTLFRGSDGVAATGTSVGGGKSAGEAAAVMPDPNGILGQSFLILGNTSWNSPGGLNMSKYDLVTNTLTNLTALLPNGTIYEGLEVIPHTNGNDYWILVNTTDQKVKSYLYTKASGFSATAVSSTDVANLSGVDPSNIAVNSFISWDPRTSNKVLIARHNKVGLANFDPSTGTLGTWDVKVTYSTGSPDNDSTVGYSVALSPNGRYIYYAVDYSKLMYYDLLTSSSSQLATVTGLSGVKIGPDNKLYVVGYPSFDTGLYYYATPDSPSPSTSTLPLLNTNGYTVPIQLPNNVYWGCITCQSGTAAPALASTNITSNPATVGDLIALLSASNQPAGTVITIHSGTPATDANKLANSTAIVAGTTYYAAFYDGLAICYSPTTAVTVGTTYCYKPAITDAGNTYPSKHGITALGRAGTDSDNWPMVRQSAWTVLEAKTKGFVVNRVKFNASNHPVADDGTTSVIANPVEGMMVYDTTNNCLKVYTTTDGTTFAWHCMTTQACPN